MKWINLARWERKENSNQKAKNGRKQDLVDEASGYFMA